MVVLGRRGGQQNNSWEGDSDWVTDWLKGEGLNSLREIYIESGGYNEKGK
jgi:hypothetical protein